MPRRSLLLLWFPALLAGQAPITLGPASATSRDVFTEVTGLVELGGGGVLVGDARERRLVLLNLDRGTTRSVASIGSGPREFRTFGGLLRSSGGGAFATDFAQRRVLPIGPDGTPREVRSYPNSLGNILRGIDARDRLYSMVFTGSRTSGLRSDTMAIVRWDPSGGQIDTLVWYDAGVTKWTGRPGDPRRVHPPIDDWVVLPNGHIVVLNATDFRVTAFADGRSVRSALVRHEAVPFTEADRREYLAWAARTPPRTMGGSPVRGGTSAGEPSYQFPASFPAFVRDGARVDLLGRIWVERSRSLADSVAVFDVLGTDFARLGSVALPRRATLAGFGRESVYLSVPNHDDELRIQRHRLPQFGSR